MLKIIDDFDLKGLEKFGFKKCESYCYCYYCRDINSDCARVSICKPTQWKDRGICFDYLPEFDDEGFQAILEEYENILFDLIQAGIVEKVEE